MSRGFPAVLTAACFAFTTMTVLPMIGFGVSDAQAATVVKSSKSNTSDRMGGGGGLGFGGVQLNPQPEPPGRAKAK